MKEHESRRTLRWRQRLVVLLASLAGCDDNTHPISANVPPPPDTIALPTGFQPEGIAIAGGFAYVGSIPTGRVFRADLATGQGRVFIEPPTGRAAIGMKINSWGHLFVAGGPKGQGYVYDAASGAELAVFTFTTADTFVNDVILTPQAAWFTDSRQPVLYRVPIGADGSLPSPAAVTTLALTGAFQQVPAQNNANGIAATPDGSKLIIVQTATGKLFTVEASGSTAAIDLGAESLPNGDGILLQEQTLYVVQNRLNQLAVVDLSGDLTKGTVARRVSDPAFDVPTTVAANGSSLYLVNARFGVASPEAAAFSVVRIDRP